MFSHNLFQKILIPIEMLLSLSIEESYEEAVYLCILFSPLMHLAAEGGGVSEEVARTVGSNRFQKI